MRNCAAGAPATLFGGSGAAATRAGSAGAGLIDIGGVFGAAGGGVERGPDPDRKPVADDPLVEEGENPGALISIEGLRVAATAPGLTEGKPAAVGMALSASSRKNCSRLILVVSTARPTE